MGADVSQFDANLRSGERLFVCVPIDFFHASARTVFLSSGHVGLTNQRYVVFTKRGMMKKRFEEADSWELSDFTSRLNSSEGPIQGDHWCLLTMFTKDEETVSAGFKTIQRRDDFKEMVNQAFEQ
jgi:hypothetical protein